MKAIKALENAFRKAGPLDATLYLVDLDTAGPEMWADWGVPLPQGYGETFLVRQGKILRSISDYLESEASEVLALINAVEGWTRRLMP